MFCVDYFQINQTEDLELRRKIRRRQKNIREKRHGTASVVGCCFHFTSLIEWSNERWHVSSTKQKIDLPCNRN